MDDLAMFLDLTLLCFIQHMLMDTETYLSYIVIYGTFDCMCKNRMIASTLGHNKYVLHVDTTLCLN